MGDRMNRERRRRLEETLVELKSITDDESSDFYAMPEPFQESKRGDVIQEGIDWMYEVCAGIEAIVEGQS